MMQTQRLVNHEPKRYHKRGQELHLKKKSPTKKQLGRTSTQFSDNLNLQELTTLNVGPTHIPTIVNGVVSAKPNPNASSIVNCPSSNKQRIVLLSDSHIRGQVSMLKPLLNNDFDLYGVVKPDSGTSELSESAKGVIEEISYNYLIIISSGTNDYELNRFSSTFQNIKNYLKNTTNTNIILMNVPYRYDLPNSTAVNKTISLLNRKFYKLVKTFHVKFLESLNERNLFTNHGLHRNKQGKNLINNQLVQLLFTIFNHNHNAVHPIPFGWYEIPNESKTI